VDTINQKLKKISYKCAHCHDYSIILENAGMSQPTCPICKGLLRIENENSGISANLSNSILFFT
jgi:transcription initiation factor IIE alpha subunit